MSGYLINYSNIEYNTLIDQLTSFQNGFPDTATLSVAYLFGIYKFMSINYRKELKKATE